MNSFDLGGQLLRVGKAVTPPDNQLLNPAPPILVLNSASIQPEETKPVIVAPTVTLIPTSTPVVPTPVIQPVKTVTPLSPVNKTSPVFETTTQLITSSSLQPSDIELTENQKKLLGMTSNDDPSASLEQQVEMTLKGKDQRLLLMRKLMQRKAESMILILRNMVGPEDVDDDLEIEITGIFNN